MITHNSEKDGRIYDHVEIRTFPTAGLSKEEAQKTLYDDMFSLFMNNEWDDLSWRAYPEVEHNVDFINKSSGWCGYARFSARRA